ncbi:cupin domain-containing protein [Fulvivirgaceae bacterium BMA10]|uniref:Cupin domain-containing protein n=1 Tax=Splendidivirga corallicola TaxID=3051826 RepID=A0ABT8KJQ2_9BACT|nr:cupin domain-containing protein [Fulvivirgaceae bacterium BMA10]
MKKPVLLLIITLILFAAVSLYAFIDRTNEMNRQQTGGKWEAFELHELTEQLNASSKRYLPFLNRNTLSTGIYKLTKGAEDKQQPHDEDEVYYILEGKATIDVDGERREVKEGSIIFVKAKVPHKFVDIKEDIKILVFFSSAESK